jgi:hypothetical protein
MKYTVLGQYVAKYEIEVEANSSDEAIELAEGIAMEHWIPAEYDFDITEAEPTA